MFIIRTAEKKDIEELVEMRLLFLEEISGSQSSEAKINLEHQLREYFLSELGRGNLVIYIAEKDQKIISTAAMLIWKSLPSFSSEGKNGRGYIHNMFTLKSQRRQGLSSKLLDKLIQTAKEMKVEKLHLHATNEGLTLYEQLGFLSPKNPELVLAF